jgi:hypothetical protein
MPSAWERLGIWTLEIIIQAFAFSVLILEVGKLDRTIGIIDIVVGCVPVLYIFCVSGYMFTTLIIRVFLRRRNSWLSAVCVASLFLIHFEILNHFLLLGDSSDRMVIRIIGSCITFFATFAGAVALTRWTEETPESSHGTSTIDTSYG